MCISVDPWLISLHFFAVNVGHEHEEHPRTKRKAIGAARQSFRGIRTSASSVKPSERHFSRWSCELLPACGDCKKEPLANDFACQSSPSAVESSSGALGIGPVLEGRGIDLVGGRSGREERRDGRGGEQPVELIRPAPQGDDEHDRDGDQ